MQHGDLVGEFRGERDVVRDEEERQAVRRARDRRAARPAPSARQCRARWSARRRSGAVGRRQALRRGRCAAAGRRRIRADSPRALAGARNVHAVEKVGGAARRAAASSDPACTTTTSAICSPTVSTGLRLPLGSWKTMPMSRPRRGACPSDGKRDVAGDLARSAAAGRRSRGQSRFSRAALADQRQPPARRRGRGRCRTAHRPQRPRSR